MSFENIAVLVDAENISPAFAKEILKVAAKRGRVVLKRAYGDWSSGNLTSWVGTLAENGFRAVHQPHCVSKKNSSDIALTVEAMDLLHGGIFDCFVIASSDSDFTPLALRLRESGATVIGFGNTATVVSLKAACDEFVVLSSQEEGAAKRVASPTNKATPKTLPQPVPKSVPAASSASKTVLPPKATATTEIDTEATNAQKQIEALHAVVRLAWNAGMKDEVCAAILGQLLRQPVAELFHLAMRSLHAPTNRRIPL